MRFFSVRDLRSKPKAIWQTLASQVEVVITSNGKPKAIMVPADESDFEDKLAAVRRAEAMRAVARTRESAAASGASGLSLEQIESEVQAIRKESRLCLLTPLT